VKGNQRPRSLRSLAEDPEQGRLRSITQMLEVKILHASTSLLGSMRDPQASEAERRAWQSRRRTLIEVWEFTTNRVWHIPGAEE
jgi:hypothetical protein